MTFWRKLLSFWWWLKNSVFLSRPFWKFCCKFFFFASFLWKSVNIYRIARMGQKGLFNYCPDCIVDGDFWVPNEIDGWNFQHMLLFRFYEASQNLSLFRQLFFYSFQGGDQRKNAEKLPKLYISAAYLIGNPEIPIHYTIWTLVEQALLMITLVSSKFLVCLYFCNRV